MRMGLTRLIQVSSTGIGIQFHLIRAIIILMQLLRIAHLKKQIKQDIKLARNLFVREEEEEGQEEDESRLMPGNEHKTAILIYIYCAPCRFTSCLRSNIESNQEMRAY